MIMPNRKHAHKQSDITKLKNGERLPVAVGITDVLSKFAANRHRLATRTFIARVISRSGSNSSWYHAQLFDAGGVLQNPVLTALLRISCDRTGA
jgi:hypothetical protein